MKLLAKCEVPRSDQGVVLRMYSEGGDQELITHQYRIDTPAAFYWGHYFKTDELPEAKADFLSRVEGLMASVRLVEGE